MLSKFHCDVCLLDCTNRVRIRCAECEEYDLCVPCFSAGSATNSHKPYHAYRVIETHVYPIFDAEWGADEELALVEGSTKLGLGNWQDIAEHVGSRSKEEVAAHYTKVYLESLLYPLPETDKEFPGITPEVFASQRQERIAAYEREKKLAVLPPKPKPLLSVPLCHEIQGYMPGRLEFEHEVEDEAEMTVKDMVFDPDDLVADTQLKVAVLDIYNSRLTTRAERKRIMLQNHMMDYRKNMAVDKRRTKEEKELLKKIDAYVRLMTPGDFDEFTRDMLTELRCRMRIQQLQLWRRHGVKTLDGGSKYEKDKIIRASALQRFGMGISRHTANSAGSNGGRGRTTTPQPEPLRPPKKLSQPLDILGAAQFELLSQEEKVLCANLRMMPKPYLAIKLQLMRDAARADGVLRKKDVRQGLKIDVNKASKIFEFFVTQGWVMAG